MLQKVKPVSFADLQDAPGDNTEDILVRFIKNAAKFHIRSLERIKRMLPALSKKQVGDVLLAVLQDAGDLADLDDPESDKMIKMHLRGKAKEVFREAQIARYALFTLFLDAMRKTKSKIETLQAQEKEK